MIETNEFLRSEAEHLAQQSDYQDYQEYLQEVELIYAKLLLEQERLKENEI